ncbi:MAG: hypothetical protein ABSG81_01655 [Acidimicrobiales bacterium]
MLPTAADVPGRLGLVPRVGLVVAACAVVTGFLAVTQSGPFSSSPPAAPGTTTATVAPTDIAGTWRLLVVYHLAFSSETLRVTSESSNGVFAGTVASPVGLGSATGKVFGTSVSFTFTLGTGSETGTATVSTTGGRTVMNGDFSNASGGSGTITATLLSR